MKFGNITIGGMSLGSTRIGGAKYGNTLVFDGGGGQPVIRPVFYDYLYFDGTAYIDTDIIPDANASYRVSLGNENNKSAQRVFICPADNSTIIGFILSSSTTSTRRAFAVYYGATSAVDAQRGLNFTYTSYAFYLTPKGFGWGTQYYTFTKGANAPIAPLVLGMNSSRTGNAYSGRMGTFRIYGSEAQNASSESEFDNYTPAYTLRPCTYDGEAGLWCVETSTFYGNSAGAGTLSVSN